MVNSRKIFIVEDNANVLFGLQAKLRVAGYEVILSQGDEPEEDVVKKIISSSPGFVILDLLLPIADGFRILSLLKSGQSIPGLKVFVFTNLSDTESREKAMSMGADHYHLKGELDPDGFIGKLNKIINNFDRVK